MTFRQAFASVLQLFAVFALFLVGFYFVCLPYFPEARERAIDALIDQPEVFLWIGGGFFFASFLLLLGFYALNRGRTLRIQMGEHRAEIDVQVVRQTLEECFRDRFSKRMSLRDVEISGGSRIEISVSMAPLEEDAREALFVEADSALKSLLRLRFGYTKPFHLNVKI